MDEAKRAYREAATGMRKAVRGVDGTDLEDHIANAGDEAGKNLGNLGDDLRKAGRDAKAGWGDPVPTVKRSA